MIYDNMAAAQSLYGLLS